jgi:hypothetical protein
LLEHITGGDCLHDIRRNVYLANTEYIEKFGELLTAAQQAKLKGLLGEPLAAEIQIKTPATVNLVLASAVYVDKFFDHYTFEMEFLVNEAVQRELQMNAIQVGQAKAFRQQWNARIELEYNSSFAQARNAREAAVAAVRSGHDLVADYVATILAGAQRQRFREIMIQQRVKMAGLAGACGYPKVAEDVKITSSQVDQLRGGKRAQDVLDGFQMRRLQDAIGEPFKGKVTFDDRGILGQPSRLPAKAIARPAVDLKQITIAGFILANGPRLILTKEQTARLREIDEDAPKLRAILHKELSQLPPPAELGGARNNLPEARAHESLRKAIQGQCVDLLDKQQQSLLQDLMRKNSAPFDP